MLSEFKNFFVSMLVKTKNTSSKKKVFTFALLFLFLYSYVLVFAIPPSSPYLASDAVFDPLCAPGDTNCFVAANIFDAPLVESGGVVSLPAASASVDGYLSASDWNTFNGKQDVLTFGNLTTTSNPEITITGGTGAVIGTGLDISIPDASLTTRGLMTTTAQEFAGVKNFADGLGIGDSSPSTLFSIGTGGLFQVDASGDLVKINNINYTWPAAQAAGSGYVLTNDGSGGLSWSTGLSIGGTSGQLQYNNAGALGGVSGITFDGTNFDAKDSVFRIVDNSDTTKRAIFEVSGIDTGTTRTYTLPNTAGTIALTSDLSGYLKNSIGIAGGTTLIGGTASGQNLTLQSTSNATKGKILFGTSAYDEVNNWLGIGTATPGISGFDTKLHIRGTSTGVSGRTAFVVENTAANSAASFIIQNAGGKYLVAQVSGASYVGGESAGFSTVGGLNLNFGTDGGVNTGGTSKINFTTGGWQNNPTMTITGGNPGNVGIGTTTPSTALEIANGGTLKLGGGTGSGQGNILMNSNASATYDTNVTYLGSNSQTMGMIASSTPTFDSTYGPSVFLRGNSYGVISGQRGIAGLGAGNPSSPTAGEGELRFLTGSNALRMVIGYSGNVGIGQSSPTAVLHLKAGTATANTAPLKFTSGTNTTVAVAGQIEYNNTFHLTNSDATRRHIVTAPNTTKVTASAPYTNDGYIVVNIGGTDFKLMTTL